MTYCHSYEPLAEACTGSQSLFVNQMRPFNDVGIVLFLAIRILAHEMVRATFLHTALNTALHTALHTTFTHTSGFPSHTHTDHTPPFTPEGPLPQRVRRHSESGLPEGPHGEHHRRDHGLGRHSGLEEHKCVPPAHVPALAA